MATTHNLTTTYAGALSAPYIKAALLQLNALTNGFWTVKAGTVGKTVIKRALLSSDVVVDETCDATPNGTITIDERFLEPKSLQIVVQDCKTNYLNDWEVVNMGGSAWKNPPKNVVDWIIPQILATGMAKLETDIYSGDGANSGEITGIETLLALDPELPAAQEITGIAVDASNVIDEIGKVVDAIPLAVRTEADIKIGVAANINYAYIRALGGFGAAGLGAAGTNDQGTQWWNGAPLTFDGVQIVKCNGMTDNVMIASRQSNNWFGTWLMRDLNRVEMIDLQPIDLSMNFKFAAHYTAGVNYGFAGEIVTYGIVNGVN